MIYKYVNKVYTFNSVNGIIICIFHNISNELTCGYKHLCSYRGAVSTSCQKEGVFYMQIFLYLEKTFINVIFFHIIIFVRYQKFINLICITQTLNLDTVIIENNSTSIVNQNNDDRQIFCVICQLQPLQLTAMDSPDAIISQQLSSYDHRVIITRADNQQ